jgi:hypothetical protein
MRWVFFSLPNPSSRTMALGSTQPLTQMSTRNLPGGKKRLACRADNPTAIYEPNVWKCGSLHFATLRASTACTGKTLPLPGYGDAWVSEDRAPPFLTSALDGGEWSPSHPGCVTPGRDPPVSEPVWTLRRRVNPGRPARSQSLYRLSYPGCRYHYSNFSKVNLWILVLWRVLSFWI